MERGGGGAHGAPAHAAQTTLGPSTPKGGGVKAFQVLGLQAAARTAS
jgi:hypothetical protein